jgi:hypothetical protein
MNSRRSAFSWSRCVKASPCGPPISTLSSAFFTTFAVARADASDAPPRPGVTGVFRVEKPGPTVRFIDPVLGQARGGDLASLICVSQMAVRIITAEPIHCMGVSSTDVPCERRFAQWHLGPARPANSGSHSDRQGAGRRRAHGRHDRGIGDVDRPRDALDVAADDLRVTHQLDFRWIADLDRGDAVLLEVPVDPEAGCFNPIKLRIFLSMNLTQIQPL